MNNLNDIVFITSDPQEVLDEILKIYKEKTGITLPSADPRRIDYDTIAYYLSQIRASMNESIKQNFLRYATGARLDLKGEIYGTAGERIPQGIATTTIRCNIQTLQNRDIIIPKGTRFIKDTYVFSSIGEGVIKRGEKYTDIIVECNASGFVPQYDTGEIKDIIDMFDFYESCLNITKVVGGADEEDDTSYKERLREVPESFSTAGPYAAYEFWVRKFSSLIKDVHIDSPNPCFIDIYIIGALGENISQEIKSKVLTELNAKRPLGDRVQILDPGKINFEIDITYYIHSRDEGKASLIDKNIKDNINLYIADVTSKIGEDIDYQEIITICKNSGAKRVIIRQPTDNIAVAETQIAKCTNISIVSGGIE
ncbi:MAG: baseplate J/gp47 family protein [Cetobacterium sp.]|uniref:baseplate assembly protein n=1 Tax=Cetobacterium sp. TaxID=2071632 RepID=UPI002FC720F4